MWVWPDSHHDRRHFFGRASAAPEQPELGGGRGRPAHDRHVLDSRQIALLGNPNCGKTALFNLLTGSRQKVANYAGVTVERKEGLLTLPSGKQVRVLDLPGAYSLNATSADETVTRDVVNGKRAGEAPPDLLVCVTDATNLRLTLRIVIEARRLGRPMLVALNLADVARKRGIHIDVKKLEAELGVPVVETVAVAHRRRRVADGRHRRSGSRARTTPPTRRRLGPRRAPRRRTAARPRGPGRDRRRDARPPRGAPPARGHAHRARRQHPRGRPPRPRAAAPGVRAWPSSPSCCS